MSDAYHLYTISFTVGSESGIALVSANSDKDAFQILKNGGSRHCDGYSLIQTRDIGMTTSCHYGLLMESFVNAMEAFRAIVSVADKLVRGEKGEDGKNIWAEMYVDSDMYLHLLESELVLSPRMSFDQSTGYLILS